METVRRTLTFSANEREEAKLRAELDAMLATPLGAKAERRMGVASARYPSRGDGGAKLAAAAAKKLSGGKAGGEEAEGVASAGGDGSKAGGDATCSLICLSYSLRLRFWGFTRNAVASLAVSEKKAALRL